MHVDGVVDACATCWTTAWLAAHGVTGDKTRDQMMGVRAQAAAALSATPGVATPDDAQRQGLAEALLVQSARA